MCGEVIGLQQAKRGGGRHPKLLFHHRLDGEARQQVEEECNCFPVVHSAAKLLAGISATMSSLLVNVCTHRVQYTCLMRLCVIV